MQKELLKKYRTMLERKLLRLCPYGEKELRMLTKEVSSTVGVLSLGTMFVLLLWNMFFESESTVYFVYSLFLGIYLIVMEVPSRMIQEKEDCLYRELSVYFSRVKHKYVLRMHVPNAVLDAADGLSYEVQRHAMVLYRILMETNRKEQVREYVLDSKGNRYLKLFLVQAYETSEKGDVQLSDETSLFINNIEHLRLDLQEDIFQRRKRSYEFAGYNFVAIAPFFMMPVLKQWGLSFAPELELFYAGTGVLLETITFLLTIVIYGFICRAREIALFAVELGRKDRKKTFLYRTGWRRSVLWLEEHTGRWSMWIRKLLLESNEEISYGELMMKMFLIAVASFCISLCLMGRIHFAERNSLLKSVSTMDTIAPLAEDEKKRQIEGYILEITKQCIKNKEVSEKMVRFLLLDKIHLSNTAMERAVVEEIVKRTEAYYKSRMDVGEVLLCFFGGIFAGSIPLLRVWHRRKTALARVDDEIRQFQSVVIMERRMKDMTVINMLEDMEVFSLIFRGVLRTCINSYSSGPEKALERLKEQGRKIREEFAELADAFLAVDDVGISKAFAEVEHNRLLFDKMSKLEEEISMEKKKDSTELLAKIPLFLTVGTYFIIPFFAISLRGVAEVFTLMEEIHG